jgi:hypothetical protein
MALSDTALRVLTEAGQHASRLATPPRHLPAAACNAVVRSLLKGGYVEECPAPFEYIDLGWRQTAVSEQISTTRSPSPYQSGTVTRCHGVA